MPGDIRALNNQWVKGQSGNPGGRPKEVSLIAEVRKILLEPVSKGSKIQRKHMVAATLVNLAQAGDMNAIKLIISYTDGQPVQKIDMELDAQITVQAVREAVKLIA